MFPLFRLLSRLPLRVLHGLGAGLGWLTWLSSSVYRRRMDENLALAGLSKVRNAAIAEAGKAAAELPWIWCRPIDEVLGSMRACQGWEHVEAARAAGRGVIFLTPHLGCFEISSLYASARIPITVLYRPPRKTTLEPIMRAGRERSQVQLARTDIAGVRALLKALKRNEAIGLLPDQVPSNGEGEWASFFGRPAYTMTLVGRLIESTNAAVLMVYVERLPRGAGYEIHFEPLKFAPGQSVTQQMNEALETTVRACPAQYLWSYRRYKVPAGVAAP
ncbi:MAG: lysophospholipid acyltransferase family protein [Gallionellaceae bacterium]|jgi:KDO2-lipid IV(A) lauroyltransferase|nr:lysophospholipid acyltransferase family protein [Gallionellaceae bacterium]